MQPPRKGKNRPLLKNEKSLRRASLSGKKEAGKRTAEEAIISQFVIEDVPDRLFLPLFSTLPGLISRLNPSWQLSSQRLKYFHP